MAISDHKINNQNRTIQDLSDRPYENNLSAQQLKEKFDHFPELLRQKHNALVDEVDLNYITKEEFEPLNNNVNAYVGHLYNQADSQIPGHIKIDNQTLGLNEEGQLAVIGGGGNAIAASYEEAINGEDNSKIMTPLRVKEALEKDREKAYLEAEIILQEYQPVTAMAWDSWGSFLAVGLETGSPAQHHVAIWGLNGAGFEEYSRVAVGGKVLQIGFCPIGMALAVRYLDRVESVAKVAVIRVNGNILGNISILNIPNGAVDIAWNPFLGSGASSILAVVNPGIIGKVYIAMVRQGVLLGVATYNTQTQLAWKKVCVNTKNRHFITLVGENSGWDKVVVEMTSDSSPNTTFIASYTSRGTISSLAWRRYGVELALIYASASQGVHGELLSFNAVPASLASISLLDNTEINHYPLSCAWRGDGSYLAVIYNYSQTGANIRFYRYMDGQLYFKAGKRIDADNCSFAWHPEGLRCVNIGTSNLNGAQELFLMELRDKDNPRYFSQSTSFTAAPGLFYKVKRPNGAGKIIISCFNNTKNGDYFRFIGKYPDDIEINPGSLALEGETGERASNASCPGVFEVIFATDGLTSSWTVKRLSTSLATPQQAQEGADDTVVMAPFTTALAIEERCPRDFTYVIAAANSPKKAGADFICSGQADHLVIQQAIDALGSSGGKLVFKEGIYNFDLTERPYLPSQNVYLLEADNGAIVFEGMGAATVFRLADNSLEAGKTITLLKSSGNNNQVRNILFDGNKSQGNSAGSAEALFFYSSGSFTHIYNCHFKNFAGSGINNGSSNLSLDHCIFENCLKGVFNYGYGVNISDCSFLNNSDTGIHLSSCNGFNLRGNYLSGNTEMAVLIESGANGICLGNMLIGSKQGIKASYGGSCLLQSNFIRRSSAGGQYSLGENSIFLEGCSNFMVLFNDCLNKAVEEDEYTTGTVLAFSGNDWNRA